MYSTYFSDNSKKAFSLIWELIERQNDDDDDDSSSKKYVRVSHFLTETDPRREEQRPRKQRQGWILGTDGNRDSDETRGEKRRNVRRAIRGFGLGRVGTSRKPRGEAS